MSTEPVKIIYGTAGQQPDADNNDDVSHVVETLRLLKELGVKILDTAQLYGRSEEALGFAGAGKDFIIDTKSIGGFVPGTSSTEGIIEHGKAALKKIGIDQIDVYYLHSPDTSIPWEQQLEGVQQLYKDGVFKRFGLSNFTSAQVREVHDLAKSKGYVLPTVYQGNYSAVARAHEAELHSVLREYNMSYYAYSPIAGGFLAKTRKQLSEAKGRWTPGTPLGNIYRQLYEKPALLDALDNWSTIADSEGISPAELAYRWVRFHSALKAEHGDAVVFGATTDKQLKQTVGYLNAGPLGDKAVQGIEEIWQAIKEDAPFDNFHSYKRSD